MELLFPKETISYLRQVKHEIQNLEETQELRMPDEYPDIRKILGSWGQVLIRGKEWHDGSMAVTGGVMVWILYQPECEEANLQTVEAWIPFQMKWELEHTQRDGMIRVVPLLRSIDARTTSARKMVARVTVSVMGEALVREEKQYCTPPVLPEDINLLKEVYPVLLPREAGEKTFDMEEELTLPGSCPKLKRIVRFSLQPELIDQKVMSGKLVFRGVAVVHLLYMSEDDQLCTWDFEVPFSRYADLEDVYEQDARSGIVIAVSSLELQESDDGSLSLKAGLIGQYIVYDRAMVQLGRDAYSVYRTVEKKLESLTLPAVLQMETAPVSAELSMPLNDERIVDLAFYPDQPKLQRKGDAVNVQLSGVYHILTADNQNYSGTTQRWNGQYQFRADPCVNTTLVVIPSGLAQKDGTGGKGALRADLQLNMVSSATQGISTIAELQTGEVGSLDPSRPSLILRHAGKETLWEIAKSCGSTVEAIKEANQLEDDPGQELLLLIPVV